MHATLPQTCTHCECPHPLPAAAHNGKDRHRWGGGGSSDKVYGLMPCHHVRGVCRKYM